MLTSESADNGPTQEGSGWKQGQAPTRTQMSDATSTICAQRASQSMCMEEAHRLGVCERLHLRQQHSKTSRRTRVASTRNGCCRRQLGSGSQSGHPKGDIVTVFGSTTYLQETSCEGAEFSQLHARIQEEGKPIQYTFHGHLAESSNVRAGRATFLIKVKSHRGEPINERADVLAEKGREISDDNKRWDERTDRMTFEVRKGDTTVRSVWTNSVRNAFRKQAGRAKLQEARAAAARHWTERVWYRHNQHWLQATREGTEASKSGG
jgi:hypothetical protein